MALNDELRVITDYSRFQGIHRVLLRVSDAPCSSRIDNELMSGGSPPRTRTQPGLSGGSNTSQPSSRFETLVFPAYRARKMGTNGQQGKEVDRVTKAGILDTDGFERFVTV